MYHLDRNEFLFDLPQKCLDALHQAPSDLLTRYAPLPEANVKNALSERIANEFGVLEECVLLGYGCEDLLMRVMHNFAEAGDKVLLGMHAWWYYRKIADRIRAAVVQFPRYRTNTSFFVDTDEVMKLYAAHHPKIILLASPNNPTGETMDLGDIEAVVSRCSRSMIVLDETYWGFGFRSNSHIRRFIEQYENVMILRSFSKYYGLAGARIGFAFINPTHRQMIADCRNYLGFNRLAEELALTVMDCVDHFQAAAGIVESEKRRFYEQCRRLPGVRVYDSKANFLLFSIPENAVSRLRANFEQQDIKIKPMTEEGLEHHFRITVAPPSVNSRWRSKNCV